MVVFFSGRQTWHFSVYYRVKFWCKWKWWLVALTGALILIMCFRLQRWSFFSNDGMVMFFFRSTIAFDGFSMVLLQPDHHLECFSQIDHWHWWFISGFSKTQVRWSTMVLTHKRDLEKRVITTYFISFKCEIITIRQGEEQMLSHLQN